MNWFQDIFFNCSFAWNKYRIMSFEDRDRHSSELDRMNGDISDNIVFIYHVIICLMSHWLTISLSESIQGQWVRSLDLTTHTSLSPIRLGFAPGFVNYKKGCTRLAAASDKVYQLLAQGRWFFPGTPASSTTKTGRHDIAEILLKVALNTKIQIQIQFIDTCTYNITR